MIPVQQLAESRWQSRLDLDEQARPLTPVVVIDADDPASRDCAERAGIDFTGTAAIVVAVTHTATLPPPLVDIADVCLTAQPEPASRSAVVVNNVPTALAALDAAVAANPVAALTLTWLLRGSTGLPVCAALAMESTAYSMLLAASEFRGWLARRGEPRPPDGAERVRVARAGNTLTIVLARSDRRNAVDAAMRDALVEALRVAEADPALDVVITGEGPSFSAGGDLNEFGIASDVAVAHLIRVTASAGALIHRLRERVTARVHGLCIGAGIELPAFAGRLVAAAGSEFALPEVSMGLIPGAGGTVSIPARIGRHRTLWLALTASRVPADVALSWGLVDAID